MSGYLKKPALKRPMKMLGIFLGVLFCDQLLKFLFHTLRRFSANREALLGLPFSAPVALVMLALFLLSLRGLLGKKRVFEDLTPALILIAAGITSNSIDRLRLGFVIDYIDFGHLFAFNLADLALLGGALLFVWRLRRE